MQQEEIQLLVISFSIVLFALLILVFLLFFFFHKKKSQYLLEKMESEMLFQSELAKSSIEIKDATMNSFSRELHDNVGQLLSVAVMHLNLQIENPEKVEAENIIIIKKIVEKTLNEIRVISKLINGEIQFDTNFTELLHEDLKRIELLKNIKCTLVIEGVPNIISQEHQIIIYRMLQETITNILKHSQSNKIEVEINNTTDFCKIVIKDFGKGFEMNDRSHSGFGLNSIRTRAKLINADYRIQSVVGKGTTVTINYFYP